MCLWQLIPASPKEGEDVDPHHRRGPWAAAFYDLRGCSCTNCLQAEASPDLWRGFVRGGSSESFSTRGSPWAGVQLPVPCGMAMTGYCSARPSGEQCSWGKGSPSLGPAFWQGFAALPAVFIWALMCATWDGVSLSVCWVFPAACPVLGSHAWALSQPHTRSVPFPTLLSLRTLLVSGLFPPSPV